MDKTVTFSQMIKKSNTDEWYTTAENVEMIVPFLKNKGADQTNKAYRNSLRASRLSRRN